MNTEHAQVGWSFWLGWALASTIGLVVGLPVGFFVGEYVVEGEGAVLAVGAAVGGASVGIAQWFVLRRRVSRVGWWVLASIVGFVAGGAVLVGAVGAVGEGVIGIGGAAVPGASVGIAQWFVLRREVSRAGWWVIASAVGFAMGGALVLAALRGAGLFVGAGSIDAVQLVLGLAAYSAITGGVLVWLLRRSAAKEISPQQAAV